MSISKDLICLANIEKSFEILEPLRSIPGNESLQDLWNNLLEIQFSQISILREHDKFGFVNAFKKTNSNNISTQSENIHQENKLRHFDHSYK